MIETADLVKTFGETRTVDGVDLAVPTGTVYGVIGPNGADRTTTVKMLATLLRLQPRAAPSGGAREHVPQAGGSGGTPGMPGVPRGARERSGPIRTIVTTRSVGSSMPIAGSS